MRVVDARVHCNIQTPIDIMITLWFQVSRSADPKHVVRNRRHYLGENKWPARNGLELKQSVEMYAEQCSRLAKDVLSLLAVGMGASTNTFHDLFGDDALQVHIRRRKVTKSSKLSCFWFTTRFKGWLGTRQVTVSMTFRKERSGPGPIPTTVASRSSMPMVQVFRFWSKTPTPPR